MQVTIQTKITDEKSESYLELIAEVLGNLRGKLLRDLLQKKSQKELKKQYIREGLLARQYNSLEKDVKAAIASAKELRKLNIENIKERIQNRKKRIKNLKAKLKRNKKSKKSAQEKSKRKKKLLFDLHQSKRKLASLEHKREKLEESKLSICWGTKKLFLAQFAIEDGKSRYEDHASWKKDWRKKRNNRIFYVGSKDEKMGNQNCQLLGNQLEIRVPRCLEKKIGQYIRVPVKFSYGHEIIAEALKQKQAINYRFVRKEKGWYLFLTTERREPEIITKKKFGAIGIDVNKDHLAWSETDRFGNLICFGKKDKKIKLLVQDRRSDQVNASLGDAIKKIVEYAKSKEKPIVIEKLDFRKKKNAFVQHSKQYRRMLSYFSYSKFLKMIHSKAKREGVEIIEVNPAFTSIIGKLKYSPIYGISIHIAASLVIARRGLNLTEKIPTRYTQCLAEHRHRHAWKQWSILKAVSNRESRVGLGPRLLSLRRETRVDVTVLDSPPW